jgi:hypothetical protein
MLHDVSMTKGFALGIGADTGLWLMPVQYERKARAAGNALKKTPNKKRRPNDAFIIF